MKKTNFLSISIKKKSTHTVFTLKANKELEDFFTTHSNNEKMTSENWRLETENPPEGLPQEFYKLTDELQTRLDSVAPSAVFNDVGAYLVEAGSGRVNIAFLRAVGISKGITITCRNSRLSMVDNFELEMFAKRFAQYAKAVYERFIEKKDIKAVITIEV